MIAFNAQKLNSYSQYRHDHALAAAKKYLVAEAELLRAIIEIDKDQTYKKLGYDHLTPYCIQELNLSDEIAGTFVRVARKSHEVPNLVLAVDAGLQLSKAKTIVSVLTPQNQTEWISKAQTLSKAKLEKEVAIVHPSPLKLEKAKPVGENRNRIEFELNDKDMELQLRCRDLVSAKLGRQASLAEVQKYLLENFIKHQDPVAKADRAKVRSEKKSQSVPALDCSRERSDSLKQSRSGNIAAAVVHAVNQRDRRCCQAQKPDGSVCLSRRWVELHHIVPRARGGQDTPDNLITLCSGHHRLWHERQ